MYEAGMYISREDGGREKGRKIIFISMNGGTWQNGERKRR